MEKLARRLAFLFCSLLLLLTALAAPANAQLQPQPLSVTGLLGFAMHTEFAATVQNLGIRHNYIGYSSPTPTSAGGFPVVGGTLIGGAGYGTGELHCSGNLQYWAGSLVMDLRNWEFSNTFTGATMTAAVYLNNIYQGRQIIFLSQPNELSNIAPGLFPGQGNSPLYLDPAFAAVFVNFFQVPQLLNNPLFLNIGFTFYTLNLVAS